jgi:aspartyl-tRNA(Asn)/glutamyl-tRNA(Gln) amidotransferase subunit A
VQTVLKVIAGQDEFDSTVFQNYLLKEPNGTRENKYRFCYFSNALEHSSLDPQIASSIQQFIESLKVEGHTVAPVEFDLLDYIVPAYYVLTTAEASSNLSRYDGIKYGARSTQNTEDITTLYKQTRSKAFGPEVKRRILLGTFVLSAGYFDAYFTKAQQVRKLLTLKTQELFKDFDAIILPTVPTPAFKLGEKKNDPIEMFLADIYTVYANLVGIPGISIPLFNTKEGLPFGLQLMTSQQNDLLLLRLSNLLTKLSGRQPA